MNNVKTIMYKYWDLFLFFLILLTKLLFYGKALQIAYFKYMKIIIPSIGSILILICISILFKRKGRLIFLFICNFILSLFIIGDLNYFRYFKDLVSLPVLVNSLQLGDVGSSVLELFNFTDLFYIIDIIFLIPVFSYIKKKNLLKKSRKPKLTIFLIILIIALPMEIISFYKLSKEQPRLITTMYNKPYIAKKLGVLNYHYIDFYSSSINFIRKKIPLSTKKETEIKDFFNKKNSSIISKNYKSSLEGKNLIIIQVEALQNFVINKTIHNKEITPNLNKLLKSSLYFNNYFYQIASGSTSDAEFMCNNSLYPASSGAAYFLYAGNEFNSLPSKLQEKGYTTAAFHGYKETFWNRNLMYKKMNFDKFYSEKDYNIEETIGLGLSDKSFLNQTIGKLKTLKEPYYSFIITLTSHFPYNDIDKYGDFPVEEFEETLVGNYLKSIHYTDEQLGIFINKLKEEKILNNSILVIYGDHYAIPKQNQQELAKFLGKDNFNNLQWMELQKVPLIIHTPNDKFKGLNSEYCGEMDLYPTLANLLNISNKYMFGRDILNTERGNVVFRNGSFTDGKIFYLSQTNSYYNVKTGKEINETENLKNKKQKMVKELDFSDNILKHNLLKKFKTEP
ncbi:LTA synthase family protein [Clostridium niameyense]|uniref:LTA synthase family protein n=1 Tax=Clostridium niameyense TaxID=1622073 RepID=A0A6M0R7K6_9CLOT|nr:LTA synthase family protein [Clostridium niameyense]NEZ45757.1 LTA synthase family protein [Clostridium niameyense]